MGNLKLISINDTYAVYLEQLTHPESSAKTQMSLLHKIHRYYRCQNDMGKGGQVAAQWAR